MYMIIYRLADGKAWKSSTLDITALTTMQFEDRMMTNKIGFDTIMSVGGEYGTDPEPPRTASTETAAEVWTCEPDWAAKVEKHDSSKV